MSNIMLDIETLGTRSTSVILSLGAVEFDKASILRTFHKRIDIDSCLRQGLTVDGRTIQWWMDQSDEARQLFREDGEPLAVVLFDFCSSFEWDDKAVWCNGAAFDFPIVENALLQCDLQLPWAYYNTRDYRTLKNLVSRQTYDSLRVRPKVAHNALDDAIAQARTLQALLDHVKEGEEA